MEVMEAFHQTVGLGMVCSATGAFQTQQGHEEGALDSNCCPRSVMMVEGMPKRDTQPATKARATASAVMEEIGIASGHRVNLSTHVSKCVNPCEVGSGPTRSMWTVSNLRSGAGNEDRGAMVWRWIFARWHGMQVRVHRRTSALTQGQTKRVVMRR